MFNWLDRFVRDSEGQIVIFQLPNLPITVWAVSMLLKFFFSTGRTRIALELISFGSLFTWAWEELFQGQSYFRKSIGLVVLVGAIWWHIQQVNRLSEEPTLLAEIAEEPQQASENIG
jgi:hypothetical protein